MVDWCGACSDTVDDMILLKAGGFEVVVVGRGYYARSSLKSQVVRSDCVSNCL